MSPSVRDGPVAPDVSSPLAVQEFTSTKTKDVQMTDATLSITAAPTYEGTNRLILGIVLAVVTLRLFAQTTLNVAPTIATTCTSPTAQATSRSASPHCFRVYLLSSRAA